MNKKVNSSKLKTDCSLNMSVRTIQRHMKRSGFIYRKVKSQIVLSKRHKEERMKIITQWISSNHKLENTIFTDEKRFSFDGSDDWRTCTKDSECLVRQKRQCQGGGLMVWLMAFPNGLLSFKIIKGKLNSSGYINMLKNNILPIIKLNYGNEFYYQEDNSPVHKAKVVKQFMIDSGISVLEWPAKSPDLNIVEDIWKIISDTIYDGPQFQNTRDLEESIKICIRDINSSRRHVIENLYKNIRSRLCKVIANHGNLYNK